MKLSQALPVLLMGLRHYGVLAQAGYFIDTVSCSGPQRDAVKSVLANSFRMVKAGLDNVDQADENMNGPEQKLIDNLFGTETNTNAGVRSRFEGIMDWSTNEFDSEEQLMKGQKSNNVKIYCDERRLKVRKSNPLKSTDTDTFEVENTGVCNVNLAYVATPNRNFQQLQICPKLMTIITQNNPATAGLPNSLWKKMTTNFVTVVGKILYQPIDRMMLADKVLLHEMTHLAIGGETDDVGGFFNAYGWKNCRALSARPADAKNNADSYALYGSVSLLIRDQMRTVNDQGQVVDIGTNARRAVRAIKRAAGRWVPFVA